MEYCCRNSVIYRGRNTVMFASALTCLSVSWQISNTRSCNDFLHQSACTDQTDKSF